MTAVKSAFLNLMIERGHVHQCSDLEALDAAACKGVITGYIGYDATATSLHIGNLASIMMLRRMQQTGHKPIALVGGGTTKVGDPSFKTESRPMLTDDQINQNIVGIKKGFAKFLTFGEGEKDAILVNNYEWLGKLEYLPFLREVGRHFTINRMLSFDSVKLRLEREQPLTFLEFNYMIMQGYDFVELHKRYGAILQMGGSDQWGNIINGVELGRRMNNLDLFALTTPLLMTSSGEKMGKTVGGAVWLNEDRLSPYDYWQYWRNTEDADVTRFMKIFTDLPLDEIERLGQLKDSEINEAKKILAFETTKLCHGVEAAEQAAATAKATFEGGGIGANLPTYAMADQSVSVVDALVGLGFAASKGEARRLVEGGGVRLNDAVVSDVTASISATDLIQDSTARLSAGKKRHGVVKKG
ncbi:MAG: tyrosine--tRNA ligase [Bdellovibrionales bacterium]|jgi:tyrosyl-tRNA synthetase